MIATTRSFLSSVLRAPRLAVNTLSQAFLAAVVLFGLVLVAAPKPVEDVSRATLDNGLRVVIVRSSLAPVVTTVVNYLVDRTKRHRASRAWPTL